MPHGAGSEPWQEPSRRLREVEHFFSIYKDLENKTVEIIGWDDKSAAHRVIESAIAAFKPSTAKPE